jgi:hypothetical protein
MALDFWNNPIVVSAFRVKYRRGGVFNVTTIYLLLLTAGGMVLWHYNEALRWGPWPRNYLLLILGIQLVISALIAANATASSIRSEVANRTLDFQRIAALSPRQILLGKLLGEPALAYLLAIATVPLAFYCWVLGVIGLSLPVLLLMYVNLASTTLLFGSLGLLQRLEPTAGKSAGTSGAGAGWGLLAFIFLPQVLANAGALLSSPASAALVGLLTPVAPFYGIYQGRPWQYCLSVYGLEIPFLLVTPLAQLGLAGLCFHVMVRRLINPLNTALSKSSAYLTLLVVDLIAAAALYEPNSIGLSLERRCAIFCLVHLLVALWLSGMVTPWRESLQSWVWRYRGRAPWFLDLWLGERSQNGLVLLTFALLGLFTLALLVVWPGTVRWGILSLDPAVPAMAATSALLLLVLGTFQQWFLLLGGRAGWGAFLTLVVVLTVPVHLLGTYYESPEILALTPSAHFARWLGDLPAPHLAPLWIVYTLFLVAPWLAVQRRLRRMEKVVDHKLQGMGVLSTG